MAHILLVEDDEFFRSALKDALEESGHKVAEAPDGHSARQILVMSSFDLVISDIQMPYWDGIELLEWIKKERPHPVILMTGFSHVLETKKAHDLGADDFLPKPFRHEEILESIKNLLGGQSLEPQSEDQDPGKLYCKLSIEDFVIGNEIPFSIYVQLNETKYIKMAHRGEDIPRDKINQYKNKGLKYLFVRKEDFKKLVGFNLKIAKSIQSSKKISQDKKNNFIRYTAEVILERAFVAGVDNQAFKDAAEFVEINLQCLCEDGEIFMMLEALNSHTDYIYSHSLGVSLYSVLIAKEMGWLSTPTLFKLAVGGLFHDIGKKEIDGEILEKQRPLLTYSERALIETHTTRGKEILQSIKSIPSEVAEIAYQHHEDGLGQGYPRGLESRHDIHPLARVVAVANKFCKLTIKEPHNSPVTAPRAIEEMEIHYKDVLDPDAFMALQRLIVPSKSKAVA